MSHRKSDLGISRRKKICQSSARRVAWIVVPDFKDRPQEISDCKAVGVKLQSLSISWRDTRPLFLSQAIQPCEVSVQEVSKLMHIEKLKRTLA